MAWKCIDSLFFKCREGREYLQVTYKEMYTQCREGQLIYI